MNSNGYDSLLAERRRKWLNTPIFNQRYRDIRKAVENIYNGAEVTRQLEWFTPHDVEHIKALESNIYELIPSGRDKFLSDSERFLLLAGAWLHDLGMIRMEHDVDNDFAIRDKHHQRSEKYIVGNYASLGLSEAESSILGLLAYYHRRRCPINECIERITIPGHCGEIRVRLLAAYLRLADALHVDLTRAPSDKYAILLTYNIPDDSKLHWLKSSFVLSIPINPNEKTIKIVFKKLTDAVLQDCLNDDYELKGNVNSSADLIENNRSHDLKRSYYNQTLDAIYDTIYKDLEEELNSVKEVLIAGNITSFLYIKREYIQVEVRQQFLNDIKTILYHYPSINNPSSTALFRIIIETLLGIIKMSRQEEGDMRRQRVDKFLKEVSRYIIGSRKSYVALTNLIKNIDIVNRNKMGDVFGTLKKRMVQNGAEKRALIAKFRKEIEEEFKQKYFNGSIEDHSELELYYKDEVDNIVFIFQMIIGFELEDKAKDGFGLTRRNNIVTSFDEVQTIIGKIVDLNTNGKILLIEVYLSLKLSQLVSNVRKIRRNSKDFFSKEPIFNNIKILDEVAHDGNGQANPKCNILLFGYSELVVKALCGFRDSIIEKIIKSYKAEDFYFHKVDIERSASNCFNIFICEGQSKNKIDWGGKSIYHDGFTYALKLQEYNFNRLYVIPDAAAGSLLSTHHPINIHYILFGCNAYVRGKHLIHTVGHAMISDLANNLKVQVENLKQKGDDRQDESKGIKKPAAKLILVLTGDKRALKAGSFAPLDNGNFDGKRSPIVDQSWSFYRHYESEEIRKNLFFSYDAKLKEKIDSQNIMIYNPKEDMVDWSMLDYEITDEEPTIREKFYVYASKKLRLRRLKTSWDNSIHKKLNRNRDSKSV